MTALRLVSVDFLINRLVANREVAGDLLGAPLQSKKPSNRLPDFRRDARRISAAALSLFRQMLGLRGPIPSSARAPRQLSADSRFVTAHYLGDLGLVMSGFHQCMDLITFGLAEVCIGHQASSTGRSKCFDANAPQPPDPLIKVALRP